MSDSRMPTFKTRGTEMQHECWPESSAAWMRRAEGVAHRSCGTSADGFSRHPLFVPTPYYSLDACVLVSTKSINLYRGIIWKCSLASVKLQPNDSFLTEPERCRTLLHQELCSQNDSPGFKEFMKEKNKNFKDIRSSHLDSVTVAG